MGGLDGRRGWGTVLKYTKGLYDFSTTDDENSDIVPDRRSLLYFHGLYSALVNLQVDVAQAIVDAWMFKMESSDYYLMWWYPEARKEWFALTPDQQAYVRSTFEFNKDSIKIWHDHNRTLTIVQARVGNYEQSVAADVSDQQHLLQWRLKRDRFGGNRLWEFREKNPDDAFLNIENGSELGNCGICDEPF